MHLSGPAEGTWKGGKGIESQGHGVLVEVEGAVQCLGRSHIGVASQVLAFAPSHSALLSFPIVSQICVLVHSLGPLEPLEPRIFIMICLLIS
jgi:hypothetical protein